MRQLLFFLLLVVLIFPLHAQENKINRPIENFEALWSQFDMRYANFELKKVDWDKVYQEYRPKVNSKTNNKQLFEICCSMLHELNDGHVTIEPNFIESNIECGPPYTFSLEDEFNTKEARKAFHSLQESTFQNFGFSEPIACNVSEDTNFQYRSAQDYGYLRFDEMTESFILGKLKRALAQSMEEFKDKKGLIIDLRFNGGGYDRAAYQIAGRLTEQEKIGHYKKKRKKGTDSYSKLKSIHLKPTGGYQFTNPIVILTSDFTASAAEVFLLAIKDFPYVTIVGDQTEGIFSDMYGFKLPNKWIVSLSHQKFYSSDMTNYEGKGITPKYKVINTKEDLKGKLDPVIAKAIEILNEKENKN